MNNKIFEKKDEVIIEENIIDNKLEENKEDINIETFDYTYQKDFLRAIVENHYGEDVARMDNDLHIVVAYYNELIKDQQDLKEEKEKLEALITKLEKKDEEIIDNNIVNDELEEDEKDKVIPDIKTVKSDLKDVNNELKSISNSLNGMPREIENRDIYIRGLLENIKSKDLEKGLLGMLAKENTFHSIITSSTSDIKTRELIPFSFDKVVENANNAINKAKELITNGKLAKNFQTLDDKNTKTTDFTTTILEKGALQTIKKSTEFKKLKLVVNRNDIKKKLNDQLTPSSVREILNNYHKKIFEKKEIQNGEKTIKTIPLLKENDIKAYAQSIKNINDELNARPWYKRFFSSEHKKTKAALKEFQNSLISIGFDKTKLEDYINSKATEKDAKFNIFMDACKIKINTLNAAIKRKEGFLDFDKAEIEDINEEIIDRQAHNDLVDKELTSSLEKEFEDDLPIVADDEIIDENDVKITEDDLENII